MTNRIFQLKKIGCALMLSLIAPVSANAAIVNVLNIDPNAGTYSGFVSTASNVDTFDLVGTADYDGGGVADTLSFTLTRTTYGAATSISAGGDVVVGTVNNGGNTSNWYSNFNNTETSQFDVSNIVYTSGEMDGTTAVFNGFQFIGRVNIGGDTSSIDYLLHTGPVGSTTFTSNNTGLDLTSVGNSSTLFITAEAGAPGIRLRDLDLQFETIPSSIPEPSSLALLAAGFGLIGLRRRRLK